MLISAENNFLTKRAYDGCPVAMLDYYYKFKEDAKKNHNMAYDATGHLENFFNKHTPFECLSLIARNENDYVNVYWLQKTYLYLMAHIAAVYADNECYYRSMLWAKKTMDLASFFFKYDGVEVFEEYKKHSYIYDLFEEYKDFFDEGEYANFQLEWEKDNFRNRFLANDNIRQPSF